MANKVVMRFLAFLLLTVLAGCVAVRNENGLTPPVALCSRFRATLGCPHGSVPNGAVAPKVGRSDGSVMVKEWVYSGLSADVVDMALKEAVANGDIRRLYYADYEQTSYFGFVTVFNLVAYGE